MPSKKSFNFQFLKMTMIFLEFLDYFQNTINITVKYILKTSLFQFSHYFDSSLFQSIYLTDSKSKLDSRFITKIHTNMFIFILFSSIFQIVQPCLKPRSHKFSFALWTIIYTNVTEFKYELFEKKILS